MDRDGAYELLSEYTHSPNLIKHALAVEVAMRRYARHFGGDEQLWAVVGLLHDFDYEQYPDLENHPFRGAEILRGRGWPEEVVEAVLAHADHAGVERDTRLKQAIYAVDELAGFIIATALVRPDRKLASVEVRSVKKKMKDESFAAAVDREQIIRGAEELGLPLDEHIGTVLEAMQSIAEELEL
jgi:putative nucleotidyltransferase with HDIG domain